MIYIYIYCKIIYVCVYMHILIQTHNIFMHTYMDIIMCRYIYVHICIQLHMYIKLDINIYTNPEK